MKQYPPKWIDHLLESIFKDRFIDEVIGDLHEWYNWKKQSRSGMQLYSGYLKNVLLSIRPYKIRKRKLLFLSIIDAAMLNNNIKISIRSLVQHKLFTVINIIGLTASLLSFLFIYAYVKHELSYDNFHPKADNIYRVLFQNPGSGYLSRPTPSPLAEIVLSGFQDEIQFARLGQDPVFVENGKEQYYEENFYWGDSSFFEVFNFPFLYGDASHALTDKNAVVLTQEVAEKYFGKGVDPVGKLLPIKIYDGDTKMLMRIDGVLKKLPANTDFSFKMIGSIANAFDLYKQFNKSWGFYWLDTYAYIPTKNTLFSIQQQVPTLVEQQLGKDQVGKYSFYFQPLAQVHLYSTNINSANTSGNINYVITFSIIGIFIVVIASINYLNLMNARLNKRKKEAGVRKVLGANKKQLLGQFLTESNLTILASLLLALLIAIMLWPYYIRFMGQQIPLSILLGWDSLLIVSGVVILCGTLTGIYPALLLTSVPAAMAINGRGQGRRKNRVQKVLVTFQFATSVFLIISSIVIFKQVNFITNKELGFNQKQLISIKVEDRSLQEKIEAIKESMRKSPGVQDITVSGESLPSAMNNGGGLAWDESSRLNPQYVNIVSVDSDFFKTLEVSFLLGSNFLNEIPFKSGGAIIINKAAMRLLGYDNPVNQKVEVNGEPHTITGVVEDYNYQSLKSTVLPTVFCLADPGSRISPDNIIVRVNTNNLSDKIAQLEKTWKQFSTDEYFDFHFVDESFQAIYSSDRQFLKMFTLFALLSIMISCLGLYGIVLFATEERSKEISIRKVLGASIYQTIVLIARSFLLLILISFTLGIPIAINFSNRWLQQFAYRVDMGLPIILVAGVIIIIVAGMTIGINTIKAAMANPANNLRD